MRHLIKGRKLSRNSAHRKALLRNMSLALLEHGIIKTTLPKAKELRPFVESIITMSKSSTLASRRLFLSTLGSNKNVNDLFEKASKKAVSRNGGYTRIVKLGFRVGDKAPMAVLELVDRELVQGDLGVL